MASKKLVLLPITRELIPEVVTFIDGNIDTFRKSMQEPQKTGFIQTLITKKEIVSEICMMVEKDPMGYDSKTMKKMAKKIKCTVQDFANTWYQIVATGFSITYQYVIVASKNKEFMYAIDVQQLVKEKGLSAVEFFKDVKRFNIK